MKKEEEILALEGIFSKVAPRSYPCRIYGMYVWDFNLNKWTIDKKFCKKHGIEIGK